MTDVKDESSKPPRRGRPRSDAARVRILKAAGDLLDEGGLGAVTVEAVAARAGVGKPTIYRSWPNAQAVAMAALMAKSPAATSPRKGGTAVAALRRHLRGVVAAFATPAGRNAAALIASAYPETEVSKTFRHAVILKSRNEARALLQQAIGEGALRRGVDLDVALDMLYAPIFLRLLVGHQPLSEAFADALVDHALKGLGPR
jgi:AcrR family transcriptional regulator